MYLTQLFIENAGPIDKIEIDLPFNEDGTPKPIVFVGENGSGKTVLLSGIVDSFYEIGNTLFEDILEKTANGHQFYKIQGGVNIKFGRDYGLFGLKYQLEDKKIQFYLDSSGNSQFSNLKNFIVDFPLSEGQKHTKVVPPVVEEEKESFQNVFNKNAMFYLPAYRHETPFWKNKSIEAKDTFREATQYRNYYGKDIELVRSLEDNKSYLMDLVLDFSINQQFPLDQTKWANINQIIQEIKGRQDIRFGIGRRGGHRVSIVTVDEKNQPIEQLIPTIDALSLGETLLLNLFLNIIRHSDKSQQTLADITGIVLIDEIDAHLHTKLLELALPELIAIFPKIQFIITSHAPIFLMGMKETFGEDGFEIREMPTGDKISVDRFSEFQHAFEVFKKTKQFEEELKTSVANDTLPILFVEGESDKIILTNAWSKLYPAKPADFHIVNAFDCYFIQNTFLRGDVFKNNPNRVFVGLLDFDSAYEVYEKVKEKKDYEVFEDDESNGLTLKHKSNSGYVMLLPVPTSRNDMASKSFKKRSLLSIEFLFADEKINTFISEDASPGGGVIKKFKDDKKIEFANSTSGFTGNDFANFEKLFEQIGKYINANEETK